MTTKMKVLRQTCVLPQKTKRHNSQHPCKSFYLFVLYATEYLSSIMMMVLKLNNERNKSFASL